MEDGARKTPGVPLGEVFLRAAGGLDAQDERAGVVARALEHLQAGFDAHYYRGASDEEVLLGDNEYAWAVETIARLDEPRFVAAASRMIRDGAGRIAEGGDVTVEFWAPHLGDLLGVISGEGNERSVARILAAAREAAESRAR